MHEQGGPIDILYMKDVDLYEMRNKTEWFPLYLCSIFKCFPQSFQRDYHCSTFPYILDKLKFTCFLLAKVEPQILVNTETYRKLLLPGIYPAAFFPLQIDKQIMKRIKICKQSSS